MQQRVDIRSLPFPFQRSGLHGPSGDRGQRHRAGRRFSPVCLRARVELAPEWIRQKLRRRRDDRSRGRASQSRPIPGRARHQAPTAGPRRSPALERAAAAGDPTFRIEPSQAADSSSIFISPDIATCDDCLNELFDPRDRRYRYPFLNCTNCGPRLTIITGAPYDRERTTMASLRDVRPCRAEYDDPGNRRFHAQPTACPSCGPQLQLLDRLGTADRLRRSARRSRPGICYPDQSWRSRVWAAITSLARRAMSGPWRSCAVESTAMRSHSPLWCADLAAASATLRDRPGRGTTAHLPAPPDRSLASKTRAPASPSRSPRATRSSA